jgi:hypothetical protein
MELRAEVDRALDSFREEAELFNWTVGLFKGHRLETDHPEYLLNVLIRAGRLGLMPWSRVGLVDKEYRSSCRRKNRDVYGENNAWNLMVSFGKVCRMNRGCDQIPQLWGMSSLVQKSIKLQEVEPRWG